MSGLPRKVAAGLGCLAQRLPRFVELVDQKAGSVRHLQGVRDVHRVLARDDLQCPFEEGRSGVGLVYRSIVEASPPFVRNSYGCYGTAAAAVEPSESGIGGGWPVAAMLQGEAVLLQDEHDLSDEDVLEKGVGLGDYKFYQTERVQQRVAFLRKCGLSEENLTILQRRSKASLRSALLQISLKKLMHTVSYLTDEVGLSKAQAAKCLYDDFYLGSSSVDGSLRPKVQYFRQLGFSDKQLVKLICRRPQILACHMDRTIIPMTRKLNGIGLKDEDIVKVYLKAPGFVRTGKDKIDQVVEFMQGFGAGAADLPKIFRTTPKIFDLSLDGKVLQITKFFREDLELDDAQMSRVFRWPQVFHYSVEKNLRVKTDYFQSVGIPKADVARMIAMFPCMLGLNLELSLKPKVDYLLLDLKKNVNELVHFPVYMSYSLVNRIQPRYEYTKAVGSDFQSLSYYLSCGEEEFKRRVKSRVTKLKLEEQKKRWKLSQDPVQVEDSVEELCQDSPDEVEVSIEELDELGT